ncbi:L,D-transpeptidase [Vacuolonema iberomarrocanum]|uniref:L,D-transpeptidase n=1 Tax=Vacuolonema iberomarrocanum TaxID=3454632 RepID=UPI0019F7A5D3|nr:L,D-transpeptidase [filamentous cyanobacterium LEGE 07170]
MSFLTAGLLMGLQHVQIAAGGFRLGDRSTSAASTEVNAAPAAEVALRQLALSDSAPATTAVGGGGMTTPVAAPVSPDETASALVTPPGAPATFSSRPAIAPSPQAHQTRTPNISSRGNALPFNNPYTSSSTFVPAVSAMRELVAPLPDQVTQVVVDLSDRQTYVYQGTEQVGAYPVAIGMDGWETPTGRFQIIDMQVDPHWQHPITRADIPPGPGNPLGSRWIAFLPMEEGVIGFHGTYQPELLGQAVSHGCIRMHNADIEALFEQVAMGTPVIVQL